MSNIANGCWHVSCFTVLENIEILRLISIELLIDLFLVAQAIREALASVPLLVDKDKLNVRVQFLGISELVDALAGIRPGVRVD